MLGRVPVSAVSLLGELVACPSWSFGQMRVWSVVLELPYGYTSFHSPMSAPELCLLFRLVPKEEAVRLSIATISFSLQNH